MIKKILISMLLAVTIVMTGCENNTKTEEAVQVKDDGVKKAEPVITMEDKLAMGIVTSGQLRQSPFNINPTDYMWTNEGSLFGEIDMSECRTGVALKPQPMFTCRANLLNVLGEGIKEGTDVCLGVKDGNRIVYSDHKIEGFVFPGYTKELWLPVVTEGTSCTIGIIGKCANVSYDVEEGRMWPPVVKTEHIERIRGEVKSRFELSVDDKIKEAESLVEKQQGGEDYAKVLKKYKDGQIHIVTEEDVFYYYNGEKFKIIAVYSIRAEGEKIHYSGDIYLDTPLAYYSYELNVSREGEMAIMSKPESNVLFYYNGPSIHYYSPVLKSIPEAMGDIDGDGFVEVLYREERNGEEARDLKEVRSGEEILEWTESCWAG